MNRRRRRNLLVALSVLAAALIALGLQGYSSLTRLIGLAGQVDRSGRLLGDLSELTARLRAAESSQRGHLLTGKADYLDGLGASIARALVLFGEVDAGVEGEVARGAFARAAGLAHERIGLIEETIALSRAGRRDEAIALVATDRGERLMDEIGRLVAEVETGERSRLEALSLRRGNEAVRSVGWLALFLGASGLMVLGLGLEIVREGRARRRIEAGLRESERRFLGSFEVAAIGMALVGLDGRFLRVNRRLCESVGYSPGELLATDFQSITHPDDLGADLALLALLVAGEIPSYQLEKRYFHRDGGVVHVLLSVSLVRDDEGRPLHFVAQIEDVTARVSAEARLVENERRFRAIFDQTFQFMGLLDPDGLLVEANRTALEFAGVGREEVVGRPFWEGPWWSGDPALQGQLRGALAEAARGGFARFEAEHVGRDGTPITVDFSVKPVLDGAGRVVMLLPEGRDITERKGAERALRAAREELERRVAERTEELRLAADGLRRGEARLRELADAMPQIVWTARPDGHLDYYNARWYQFTGQDPTAGGDESWLPVLHPDDAAHCLDVWYRSVRTGEPYQIEYRFRDRDPSGGYRWHLGRALPVRDESGGIVRWIGTCTDIDDQKRAEAALREAEERQRRALSAATIGHWDFDLASQSVLFVSGLSLLFGRDEDTPFRDLDEFLSAIHPEDRVSVLDAVARSATPGVPYEAEFRVVRPDGSVRWLAAKGGTFLDDAGRPSRMAGVHIDVTPRKEVEAQIRRLNEGLERRVAERTAELAQAKEAAEAATGAKAEFLANMSHEIRTPMNGVLGLAELALDDADSPRQREYLGTIKASAESLLTIIDDILDFSKVEAGKLRLEVAPFGLRARLEDTLRSFSHAAGARGLALRVRVGPGVPEALVGDPHRLRQVLVNLIGNAIKFTDRGEVAVEVDVAPGPDEGEGDGVTLAFSVLDTGIGIPPDRRAAIFAPFEQADGSTTRKYGGTGLGLAICSHLAGLMGGSIGVEGRAGGGSVFRFTARFGRADGAIAEARTPAPAPATARRLRVLVAEDNAVNQLVATRMLERLGHRSEVVPDGLAALAALERGPYDLVLMDLHMPGMDGTQAVALLRDRERSSPEMRRTPVVALTAHAMAGAREHCLANGFDAYLSKPILLDDLARALEGVAPADEPPPPPASPSPPPLPSADEAPRPFRVEVIDEACGGLPEFVDEVLDSFLSEAPDDLARLLSAIDRGDVLGTRRRAHALKGACLTVGADALALACARLEALPDDAPPPAPGPLGEALTDTWSETRSAILAHRAGAGLVPSAG